MDSFHSLQAFYFSTSAAPNTYVSLESGVITYYNIVEMKGNILISHARSGIYLFTHNDTNAQYVGLASDLSNRLSDYLRPAYLQSQVDRGSYICRALLSHGYENFSLTILEYCSISELPIREQYYLDNFTCEYNINRVSSIPYSSVNASINSGVLNPNFGNLGSAAFHFDHFHTPERRAAWAAARTHGPYHLYNLALGTFVETFTSLGVLALSIGFSERVALKAFKSNMSINNIWYISNILLDISTLSSLSIPSFSPVKRPSRSTGAVLLYDIDRK
jgi:hypothetical protein